jgi:hypothetical protein
MRLLNPTSLLALPALASTTIIAFAVPEGTAALATPIIPHSSNGQLVEHWSPISTVTRPASPATNVNGDVGPEHDLLRREIVTGAAPAQPTGGVQVSPITTYQANVVVNGVPQQLEVVYTQLFSGVPDQGLAPASGSIGLGTIQGAVGVVKATRKRDANPQPTAIADIQVERRQMGDEGMVNHGGKVDVNGAGSVLALMVAITAMVIV